MSMGSAIRAGRAFIEMGLKDKGVQTGLKRVQARLNSFAKGLFVMGSGLVGASAAVLGPLAGAVKVFMGMGDQMDKASKRTAMSVEALSELKYAAERSGSSMEAVEKGVKTMNRVMLDAERGSSTAVDTLDDLGITLESLAGKSTEDRFTMIADAISKVEDPGRRSALAMQVFGRAGTELLPMLNEGADGINAMRDRARELGLTMSGEDASAAAKLTDIMADLWDVIKMGVFNIGAALAGPLTDFVDWLVGVIVPIAAWVKQNSALVVTIAKVAAIVGAVGAALIAIAVVVKIAAIAFGVLATVATVVSTVVGLVGTVIGALFSPIGLAIVAVAALVAGLVMLVRWFLTSTTAGQQLVNWLSERFRALLDFVSKVFGGVRDAIIAGDWALAGKVLWAGLKVAWLTGVRALQEIWLNFKNWFMRLFDEMFVAALQKTSAIFDQLAGFLNSVPGGSELAARLNMVSAGLGFASVGASTAVEPRDQARRAAAERDLAEADADLAKAERELTDAVGAAAAARAALPDVPFPDRDPPDAIDVDDLLGLVPEEVAKVTAVGTFSATAAARFGNNGNTRDRELALLEAIKTSVEELKRRARDFAVVS